MARRIVWTSKANLVFNKILKFYRNRNKSNTYSRKLNQEINAILRLLAVYPLLGRKTSFDDTHVFIKGHFKIFYQLKPKEIVVLLIWDTRQNPENLSFN